MKLHAVPMMWRVVDEIGRRQGRVEKIRDFDGDNSKVRYLAARPGVAADRSVAGHSSLSAAVGSLRTDATAPDMTLHTVPASWHVTNDRGDYLGMVELVQGTYYATCDGHKAGAYRTRSHAMQACRPEKMERPDAGA